nr:MAG TPA: hypothetical protein [Caudoviricetes sp.]
MGWFSFNQSHMCFTPSSFHAPSGAGLFFSVGLLRFPSLPGGFVPAPLRISSDIKEGFFG